MSGYGPRSDSSVGVLDRVAEWYQSNATVFSSNAEAVKINTLDNPGWLVKVDLAGTELENLQLENFEVDRGDSDWCQSFLRDHVFVGAGDPSRLQEILGRFLEFASSSAWEASGELDDLCGWYASHCDGRWEHAYGVEIRSEGINGWRLQVDLADTELEHTQLSEEVYGSNQDTVIRAADHGQYLATGGSAALRLVVKSFVDFTRLGTS